MQLYKKLLLSFFICTFLISNHTTSLDIIANGESRESSATNNQLYSQNVPCGMWAWEFPANLQDPRLYPEQNDQIDAGADCRAGFNIINNTGIPIDIGNIFNVDLLSYTLELFPQTQNSRIEWDFPNNQGLNQYYSVQSFDSPFKVIPINPQEEANVKLEGRLTAHSLATDIALLITFQVIKLNPCIPVQVVTFAAINTVENGGLDRTAQLLLDHKFVELKKEWSKAAPEFVKTLLEGVVVECIKGASEAIIKQYITYIPSFLLEAIWYGTHVTADYVLHYQKSPATIIIGYQPSLPSSPGTDSLIPDGYWTGPVNRPAPKQYTMNLTLMGCTTVGAVCGSIEFPELSCRGTITYLGFVHDYFRLLPTLDQGWADCVNYPELQIVSYFEIGFQPEQEDSWNAWLAPPYPQEGLIAWATLTRFDSPPSLVAITPPPSEGDCPNAPTRIKVGDTATVIQSTFLYSRPDLSQQSVIDNSFIENNETIQIIDGPVCGAQQRWYSAKHNGQVGLIPEVGPAGVYRYVAGVPEFFSCVGLSMRQLFGMRLDGKDYLVLQGTSHLIPNDDTKKALGTSASGNPWNLSEDAMRQYKNGKAVPDVNTDPIGFANFRDQLYPCFSETVLPPL